MFNDDDDDDLDITEIDQALLDGKAPVSQKTEEKDDKIINHKDSVKKDSVSRSQRCLFHCVIAADFDAVQRISSFIISLHALQSCDEGEYHSASS